MKKVLFLLGLIFLLSISTTYATGNDFAKSLENELNTLRAIIHTSYDNNDFAIVSFDEDKWIMSGQDKVNARFSNLHIDYSIGTPEGEYQSVAYVDFFSDVTLFTSSPSDQVGPSFQSEGGVKRYLENAYFVNKIFRQHYRYKYGYKDNTWKIIEGVVYAKPSGETCHTLPTSLTPCQAMILQPYWSKYIPSNHQ